MSKIPYPSIPPSTFLPQTPKPHRFLCNISSMASKSAKQEDPTTPNTSNYPVPLSPPLPAISKQIELSRAMSASSLSSTYTLFSQDIVFQDEWLLVVNKPQGIYCETILSSVPSFLTVDNTKPLELHMANRLDRDTSGLMVITKSNKVAGKLVQAFTEHKIVKTYIALSLGIAPKWERVSVKSGHGRSKFGVWRVYAVSDVGRSLPGGSMVKDMATTFEVLSVNGRGGFKEADRVKSNEEEFLVIEEPGVVCSESDLKDEVLVRAYPRSGRTHQIRLHCQYLGIPIRGDVKYEGVCDWEGKTFDGHALHAETLVFDHPVTGLQVEFRAPLPLWASQALKEG